MKDIDVEFRQHVKNSSNLRLTRELIRWDLKANHDDMFAIIKELSSREETKTTLRRLFVVCLIYSNISTSFSEHYFVFDEDEEETRRQLSSGLYTHISMLIIIFILGLFHYLIGLSLLAVYLIITLIWCFEWYTPIANAIKTKSL